MTFENRGYQRPVRRRANRADLYCRFRSGQINWPNLPRSEQKVIRKVYTTQVTFFVICSLGSVFSLQINEKSAFRAMSAKTLCYWRLWLARKYLPSDTATVNSPLENCGCILHLRTPCYDTSTRRIHHP